MPNFFINVKEKGAKGAASNIKGLTGSLKMLALQAVGVTAVVQGLRTSINMSAEMEGVKRGFDNLAKSQGFSTSAFNKFKSATDGTIDSLTLMKKANTAMLLGITKSEDQMASMFDVAQRLGQSLGIDTVQSIDSLVTGLGRQSKLMLDNLGIMVDTGKVNEDYAESVGKTVQQLTDQEKKQAFVNAAMEEANFLVSQLGEEQLTTKDRIAQMGVGLSDLAISIGANLAPTIQGLSGLFMSATSFAADFFLSLTETNLESTIRKLQEMGKETLNLELVQAKATLIGLEKVNTGVRERKTVQSELNTSLNEEFEAMSGIAQQQAKLVESGYTEEQLRNLMKIVPLHRHYTSAQIKQIELEQEQGKILLEELNFHKARLVSSGRNTESLGKELDKAIDLEASRNRVLTLEKQIADTKSGDGAGPPPEVILEQITIEDFMYQNRIDKIELQKTAFIDAGVSELEAQQFVTKQKKMLIEEEVKAKMNQVGALAGALGKLAGQHKQGAVVAKRLAQTQAIIDTYAGANKALSSAPPPWNFIAMATVIASGLANVAQIEKAQFGMNEVVSQPTMILAGEAGAEQVSITPLEGPNADGPQGGAVNVSFSGNVMSQDFIEDEAIPMIKEAIRRGADIGVA